MHKLLHKAVLPFELTNGNDGQGREWFRSDVVRKKFERDLKAIGQSRTPFQEPVIVRVTRLWAAKQRAWDSSSLGRGNYKYLEDALVSLGWFVDDGPKWIVETRFRQQKSEDGKPAILIEVFTSEDA